MKQEYKAGKRIFAVFTETQFDTFYIKEKSNKDGVEIYEIGCVLSGGYPQDVSIEWEEEMQGICSVWTPTANRNRGVWQWFKPTVNCSDIYDGAPIISVIQGEKDNFATVAFSEAEIPVKTSFYVKDFQQQDKVGFKIVLFENDKRQINDFKAEIRIDKRTIPYYRAVADVSEWWKRFYPSKTYVPKGSEAPLYSTWYNFHQSPDQETLLKDLAIAAEMGFKTVILDDGWQIDGVGTAYYDFCGDWAVAESKFPDFQAFVDGVHALGMKLMVWFPVPFVGYETQDYKKFTGMYLYQYEEFRAGVVDPRYPAVRRYLVDTYETMSRKYGLDGLKLDFIDSFMLKDETPAFNAGMDCVTLEESIVKLLEEIQTALKGIREDFMIEFRQNYVGPSIVRYCNMLRVADCAFDSLTNRIGIADLRMPKYGVAVHSDMLLWGRAETPQNCALQLLDVMFSVPQISILLQNSSDEQRKVLKNFVSYWTANADVLLHGDFACDNVKYNYPMLSSEKDGKKIAVAYLPVTSVYCGENLDLFNATGKESLYVENPEKYEITAKIYDCFGNELFTQNLCGKFLRLEIPVAGFAALRKAVQE
ncbi:MAG: alpha-galactosidase [Clostridia bacterium]|nr:alpha-galactosidase [Clostridia bacterium]